MGTKESKIVITTNWKLTLLDQLYPIGSIGWFHFRILRGHCNCQRLWVCRIHLRPFQRRNWLLGLNIVEFQRIFT